MPFLSILIISLFILVIKIGYKLNKLSIYINAMVGLSLVLQNLTIKCTNKHHLQCLGPFRARSSRVADTFKEVSLFYFFSFIYFLFFLHCCRWHVSVPALMFTNSKIHFFWSGYTSKLYPDYFAECQGCSMTNSRFWHLHWSYLFIFLNKRQICPVSLRYNSNLQSAMHTNGVLVYNAHVIDRTVNNLF